MQRVHISRVACIDDAYMIELERRPTLFLQTARHGIYLPVNSPVAASYTAC